MAVEERRGNPMWRATNYQVFGLPEATPTGHCDYHSNGRKRTTPHPSGVARERPATKKKRDNTYIDVHTL